jgi:hypothetical protein
MLKDDIQARMQKSMKEHKPLDVKVLRFLLSQINYEEIAKQKPLTDDDVRQVLAKEVKKRKDAIELFKKGNRLETIADEETQIAVIQSYLPKGLSEEEVISIVDRVIGAASDTSNPGKIIGQVMASVKGQADGALVSRLVREKLANSSH